MSLANMPWNGGDEPLYQVHQICTPHPAAEIIKFTKHTFFKHKNL